MSSSTPQKLYRPCVGIMLLNPAGRVWIGKRHPDTGADETHAWQMPQGGVDRGETPLEAARRELYEETSIRSASLIAEAPNWVSYDYPPEVTKNRRTMRYRGQTQKWFAFRFEGQEAEIDILNPPDGHNPEFCEWRWARASELAGLVIPFKRPTYEAVIDTFGRLTS
ncbi:RNA pyrophosphohydrolase [Stappia sp. ES.058]|uniref:RNA pyrophosphohydrolase n=1 Tax=Stappia sp. ES.058 TaxID=1881061 RepID=UPI00087AF3B6|nr:RNA pyrophosphohydrolase [Stappia sp. ES.058]SDU47831.1 putative (di)nucleoside polyphosphate hydrolase [Stappia sp. ES.058]